MYLRKLSIADVDGMLEWMRDPEISSHFQFGNKQIERENVGNFILEAIKGWEDSETKHYAIADKDNIYLGTISLKKIDIYNQNAEYAISLRKCAHGKGIAMSATKEILKIAFRELELKKVYLNVLADNVKAIALYEKCGFICEGEFRKHIMINGELKSLKWYGLLKEEYIKIR